MSQSCGCIAGTVPSARSAFEPVLDGDAGVYGFFFSTVVVLFVVVVCESGAVGVPSGFAGAGVVCFISVSLVVVCSVVLGAGVLLLAGGWVTTVVGGGDCWQPTSMKLITDAAKTRRDLLVNEFMGSSSFSSKSLCSNFSAISPDSSFDSLQKLFLIDSNRLTARRFRWEFPMYDPSSRAAASGSSGKKV